VAVAKDFSTHGLQVSRRADGLTAWNWPPRQQKVEPAAGKLAVERYSLTRLAKPSIERRYSALSTSRSPSLPLGAGERTAGVRPEAKRTLGAGQQPRGRFSQLRPFEAKIRCSLKSPNARRLSRLCSKRSDYTLVAVYPCMFVQHFMNTSRIGALCSAPKCTSYLLIDD